MDYYVSLKICIAHYVTGIPKIGNKANTISAREQRTDIGTDKVKVITRYIKNLPRFSNRTKKYNFVNAIKYFRLEILEPEIAANVFCLV